jgi:hypothetical protein
MSTNSQSRATDSHDHDDRRTEDGRRILFNSRRDRYFIVKNADDLATLQAMIMALADPDEPDA